MSASSAEPNGGSQAPPHAVAARYLAADGLRGVCALALIFTHVAMIQGLLGTKELGGRIAPSNIVGGFFAGGLQIFAGVFFVVTGLFVYRPFAKSLLTGAPRRKEGSVLRRLLRLLPAYWVMYAVVLVALNLNQMTDPWSVLRPFLLLHIYDWGGWINGMEITWTVPDMIQFYMLLPLIAWSTWKFALRGATPRARAYRMMVPVPFMVAVGVGWLVYSQLSGLGTRELFWWPMGLLPEVAIGMVIAIWLELSKVSPKDTPKIVTAAGRHPNLFLLVAVLCVVINMARPGSEIGMDDYYSLTSLLIFYVLLAVLGLCLMLPMVAPGGSDSRLVRAVFTNRVILFVGKVSYGIYLWQFAAMHFLWQKSDAYFDGNPAPIITLRGEMGFWEAQLATFALTLVLAVLSYYLVERPLMNWGERVIARRSTAARAKQQKVPAGV